MKIGQAAKLARGENWLLDKYYKYAANRDLRLEARALDKILHRPERIRTATWSASGAGSCKRQRQFSYLGMPKSGKVDEKTLNIFANGDYVHLRHQAFGMAAGYIIQAEVPVEIPHLKLTGTMDGMLINDEIVEFKSINNYGYSSVSSFGPKPEHILQTNAYMFAAGKGAARIIYENKDTNVLKEFHVPKSNEAIDTIIDELNELNKATEEKRFLPMLQECKNQKGRWNWCPYASSCEQAKWPGQLAIRPSSSSESV